MKKVAIYARLSDEDRDKKLKTNDSESIQNQKSMLISYALDKGWEIFNIYSDDDYSGADQNRPDFVKMLKDCEDGKIDIVLCKSQSRFSRELEVIEHYVHGKFLEWNIRFISIVDNADTDVAGNKKARQINGLINEWYLEDLSDNIKKTLSHKRVKGEFVGSFAPYGYKKNLENKNQLLIDEVAANVVRMIFEMYKLGRGYRYIAKHLNELCIPSPTEYKKLNGSKFVCANVKSKTLWTTDTIKLILQNETYIGSLVQGKNANISYKNKKKRAIPKEEWVVVKDCHEAIIDQETWGVVTSLFTNRGRQQKNGELHVFTQKVYCKHCEKILTKNVGKTSKGTLYYLLCKTTRRTGGCENRHAIRLDYLEGVVISEINKLIQKYSNHLLAVKEMKRLEGKNNLQEKKQCSLELELKQNLKAISDKQNLYKPMYEDKLKGLITEDEFIIIRDNLHADLEVIKQRINTIEYELKREEGKKNESLPIEALLKKYDKVTQLSRLIVEEFIDRIYVGIKDEKTKEREICIEWNL